MKQIRYFLEAVIVYVFFGIFKILPLDSASALGGFLARNIGPKLAASRKGIKNLEAAYPENTTQENHEIIRDVWDNLGRTMGEYPHLKTIAAKRVEVVNKDIFDAMLKNDDPAIYIGAHIGNWETMVGWAAINYDTDVDITYRAPNNPFVRTLLERTRSLDGRLRAHPKAAASARSLSKALKSGGKVGILIDQKYNEGIETTFFGHTAMTNTIFAKLAQKNNAQIYPVQVVRLKGAHFKMVAYPPLDPKLSVEDTVQQATSIVEQWIRENPGQWIWLHKRWKQK